MIMEKKTNVIMFIVHWIHSLLKPKASIVCCPEHLVESIKGFRHIEFDYHSWSAANFHGIGQFVYYYDSI